MTAVVLPTIRPEKYKEFCKNWQKILEEVCFITVFDGENPKLVYNNDTYTGSEIMDKDSDLIYNFSDGVRNLGFAFIAKYLPEVEYIITLDDDVAPLGDTIQDHCTILQRRVPISWLSTASEYTRGFPYGIRDEAEVVMSHGIWQGIYDYDAPTQMVKGNPGLSFYKGAIPKGIFYPMCGMNLAFKRKMLPYMYFAPMGKKVGVDRFGDIWCGIESKKVIDEKGWAVVTGYAEVLHKKASNVFTNLEKEAVGIRLNENYGEDDYFKMYKEKRRRWEEFINE